MSSFYQTMIQVFVRFLVLVFSAFAFSSSIFFLSHLGNLSAIVLKNQNKEILVAMETNFYL